MPGALRTNLVECTPLPPTDRRAKHNKQKFGPTKIASATQAPGKHYKNIAHNGGARSPPAPSIYHSPITEFINCFAHTVRCRNVRMGMAKRWIGDVIQSTSRRKPLTVVYKFHYIWRFMLIVKWLKP